MLRIFYRKPKALPSIRQHATSALFISDRSSKERPILTPRLNLACKFEDLNKLEKNIAARGLDSDAAGLKSLWEFYNSLNDTRSILEKRRVEIADQMKDFKKIGDGEAKYEMEKLKIEGRTVREDLKTLLNTFWEVEENMMTGCLKLPNDLHHDTPLEQERVIIVHGTPASANSKQGNHLELGKDLIDIREPHWYYLKGDAAIFDMALMHYFSDGLKSNGFIRMVPPDFCHAAVIEGSGSSLSSSLLLEPVQDKLHLVGGGSLYPFCAYYAKNKVPSDALPAKHQMFGKHYSHADAGPGLFGVWQKTCVSTFVLAENTSKLKAEFDNTLKVFNDLYEKLNWHVRVVYMPAKSLKAWESLRVSFQMNSTSLGKWVEVGNLTISESFISERLLIEFGKDNKVEGFCHILSGTAIDVTTALACVIEQDMDNMLPSVLNV